ncbi:MAG: hypothetical protein ABI690_23055 [Chloroflexota bacterium]
MGNTAVRIISTEYLQNFPILLGLMAALHAPDWVSRIIFAALGAAGTAITINLTEKIKLREHAPKQPTPLLVNIFTFFAGSAIYLGYFSLIRKSVATPLFADAVLGLLLGLAMGLAQGYGRGAGGLNTGDLTHVAGLMGAGAVLCVVIGAVAENWPPVVAAITLCIPMTLIIVRLDYWALISSPQT